MFVSQLLGARVRGAVLAIAMLLPAGSAFAQNAPVSVSVAGTSFLPATLHVAPGATVQWTNTSLTVHTVTSDDGTVDSGSLNSGAVFSTVFDTPGVYQYFCQIHGGADLQGMSGTIVVDDPSTGPAPTVRQRTPDDYQPTEAD